MADNVMLREDEHERRYLARLKQAVLPEIGSTVEVTEKNIDLQPGTRGYVVADCSHRYQWPVVKVRWLDDLARQSPVSEVAAAFLQVVAPPVKFESVTDVEAFLNER